MIQINGNVYGIAYRGSGNDGTFITIGISDGTVYPVNTYQIVSTAGNTSVRAVVNTQNVTATIVSWFVNP